MKYRIDNVDYEVVIIRKSNKNTYVRVKNDMKIYITTNYFVSDRKIKTILDSNYESLQRMVNNTSKSIEKDNNFYYLGQLYDIIIVPTIESIDITDNMILVKSEKELDRWLNKQVKDLFQKRLDICYNLFEENIPYPKLRVRKMKTRWGVCNRKNLTITLNFNLIKYEIEALDYVIIHELSHLVHFNHSKLFWETVFKYCPNYKKIRKMLKE